MADLQAIVARVKNALVSSAPAPSHQAPVAPSLPPDGHRAELVSRFARELEAVGARIIGPVAPEQLADRVGTIVRERGLKSIAMGEGVVVDLSQVSFLDSRGMAVLVYLHTNALDRGGRLRLRGVPPRVVKALTIAGLDQVFELDVA